MELDVASSSIEWTDATWNPVTGCSKVSPGCKHCYAERFSKRLQAMGVPKYSNGFNISLHQDALLAPLTWKSPRKIFVNSMSDLFHEDVPESFIQDVFAIMRQANWHQFQVLTKRSSRLSKLSSSIEWPHNVWMGVSVETDTFRYRIDHLRQTQANIKFLSLEPLLGPLENLDLRSIDWVIVGGESGPNARPVQKDWVVDIREQCLQTGVAFFFKQWGGKSKKRAGRDLDGRTWDELPKRWGPVVDGKTFGQTRPGSISL